MAVIPGSICLHWNGATASLTPGQERYVAAWRLKTDDPNDQGKTVQDWFITNVLPVGTPYTYAGDGGPTTAISEDYATNRLLESLYSWEIVVEFATPSADREDEQDTDGNPSQDPLSWRPRIQFGTTQYSETVENAKYIGGYGTAFDTRIPPAGQPGHGHRLRPCNSAFVPFGNPPVEQEISASWVRVGWNYPRPVDVDEVLSREHHVNDTPFQVTHRGLTMKFNTREAKIREVTVEPRLRNGVYFVEIDWLIEKPIPFTTRTQTYTTWDTWRLDEGTHARALPGDPDGKGGTIGGTMHPGAARIRPLTDKDGNLIYDPLNFDGDGQPIENSANSPMPSEIHAQWRHRDEINYLNENYLQDVISAWTPP